MSLPLLVRSCVIRTHNQPLQALRRSRRRPREGWGDYEDSEERSSDTSASCLDLKMRLSTLWALENWSSSVAQRRHLTGLPRSSWDSIYASSLRPAQGNLLGSVYTDTPSSVLRRKCIIHSWFPSGCQSKHFLISLSTFSVSVDAVQKHLCHAVHAEGGRSQSHSKLCLLCSNTQQHFIHGLSKLGRLRVHSKWILWPL